MSEPSVSYLVGCVVATALAAGAGWRVATGRRWVLAFAAGAALFVVPATWQQATLRRIDTRWAEARAATTAEAERAVADAIDAAVGDAAGATAALVASDAATSDPMEATRRLLPRGAGEHGLVLHRGDRAVAWAGMVRVPTDSLRQPEGLVITPFYTVLYATATRGDLRAVATVLLHAAPPADAFARGLDRAAVGLRAPPRFEFDDPTADIDATWRVVRRDGAPLIAVRAEPPDQGSARTRAVEDARALTTPAVALMILVVLAAAWTGAPTRARHMLRRRIASLLVPLAAIGIVPLTGLSNASRLFDPSVFFAPHGGPFAASIGALAITSTVALLGLFAILRARRRPASRPWSIALVVVIAGTAPFLLRDLARGIQPPPLGVSVRLWIAWQIGLFLPAAAILIAGATAGRAALGRWRGVAPIVAPTLAAIAALVGPLVWQASSGWPGWYPALWFAAVVALAMTRRTRGIVVAASAVAGLGSATLVWGVVARRRVEAAVHDVRSLTTPEVDAVRLLERLARSLTADPPPAGAPGVLLERYASSDLFAASYPVVLQSWVPSGTGDTVAASVSTANVKFDVAGVRALIADVRRVGEPAITTVLGEPGLAEVLAVPHDDDRVTTVAVFPRTRLLAESPLAPLLGVTAAQTGEPPYTITLLERLRGAPAPDTLDRRWRREATGVHSDWSVAMPDGSARAHVEVSLRPVDALAQRGALLVLLDMLIVGLLWTVPSVADGTVARRLDVWRTASARSYRARLTVALFAFFVVPAGTFAVWSYRQLQDGDFQSRKLLVEETLRTAAVEAPTTSRDGLSLLSERLGTPLLVYDRGALARASDPLFFDLAPLGLYLPADDEVDLLNGNEVTGSREVAVGAHVSLMGYRVAIGSAGQRLVIAAPARTDNPALEQRRRDLGFLVMLVAVGGALAALWLSGLAARELDRPVSALRRAALAIAAGEREPRLDAEPPPEFRPVFAAFQRMASDLSDSRSALEAAQRRTAVVLRNVASGVLAVRQDGTVTIANPRAEHLLGETLDAGTPLAAVAPRTLVGRVEEFLADPHAPSDEEFELELRDRQLRVRLTRLLAGRGDEGAAVVTFDDLTELARAQRVLAWGEMARQVAHEIKNPLTPIRLGVQHLRRAYVDRRGNFEQILDRNVARVLEEIDRLDEIARAFSRYGTAPDQREPGVRTDVAAVARDVVALERMGQGSVTWEIDGADAPHEACAREDELREVLLNLLENARHANASVVRVTVDRTSEGIDLAIVDDGDGIAAELLSRVFEPHFSTRTSGSGLGLAISRRLIEGWGGTIALDSVQGQGTTVRVTLRAASLDGVSG